MTSPASDGASTLSVSARSPQSTYSNADLLPTPPNQRTWTLYNYSALWIGMSHNLFTYSLAAGLLAIGMNAVQALLTIAIGNLIVLIPMLLNSHAGTKYGVPFPVLARAFYGIRGANLPATLRAVVACGWFGIQTWLGGEGINVVLGKLLGRTWSDAHELFGRPWTLWLAFAIFWLIQMGIIWRGMEAVRRFENWAAPFLLIVFLAVLCWVIYRAHGVGALLTQPAQLGWGARFWPVFWPSLMTMISVWATLALNMPDFSRFARSQRGQMAGQVLGLPTTMTLFSLIAVMISSGTAVIYGKAIWDPNELATKFSTPVVVALGMLTLLVATVSVNVAANIVSPSYDFSNLAPQRISRRTGGLIAGILGVLIMPWRLLSDPHIYIYAWLDFYGGVLGAVAGVMVAGYWLVWNTELLPDELYRSDGKYWYSAGWNLRAVGATLIGALLAIGGANTGTGTPGPFPVHGLIPALKPLYSYSWVVVFCASLLIYGVTERIAVRLRRIEDHADLSVVDSR